MSGVEEMDINAELEAEWPNLANTHYKVTSPYTTEYNCLAYAVYEDDRWWSPLPEKIYYWPPEVPREWTLDAFIQAYRTRGFETCENGDFEEGVEKIAIYVTPDGKPQHVARQLKNGFWTSKMGNLEDIEHELEGVVGGLYGAVKQFMKRLK